MRWRASARRTRTTRRSRRCVGPPLRESFARLIDGADRPPSSGRSTPTASGTANSAGRRTSRIRASVQRSKRLPRRRTRLFVCTSKPEVFAKRIVAHFGFDSVHRARIRRGPRRCAGRQAQAPRPCDRERIARSVTLHDGRRSPSRHRGGARERHACRRRPVGLRLARRACGCGSAARGAGPARTAGRRTRRVVDQKPQPRYVIRSAWRIALDVDQRHLRVVGHGRHARRPDRVAIAQMPKRGRLAPSQVRALARILREIVQVLEAVLSQILPRSVNARHAGRDASSARTARAARRATDRRTSREGSFHRAGSQDAARPSRRRASSRPSPS